MKLSQGNVTLLQSCPRLFQLQVLEQLGVPQLGAVWGRLNLGSQFHQLMQQFSQNLPIDAIQAIVATDRDLSRWWQAVLDYGDELFPEAGQAWTDSEHVRTWEWMGHTLVGIYDYLVLYPESAQILDWKTYPKPIETRQIRNSWQSRLYPFLLAKTSDYAPETIEMRYWFFQARDRTGVDFEKGEAQADRPQLLRLPYDAEQQAQTLEDLTVILSDLNQWLRGYEQLGEDFPQTSVRRTCETCGFVVRCDRAMNAEVGLQIPEVLTWEMVDEVAIDLI
jgi:hypothetical protein